MKKILNVIWWVLGGGVLLMVALFWAEMLAMAGAWVYALLFHHGQMASDRTIFIIALVICIFFTVLLIPGSYHLGG